MIDDLIFDNQELIIILIYVVQVREPQVRLSQSLEVTFKLISDEPISNLTRTMQVCSDTSMWEN